MKPVIGLTRCRALGDYIESVLQAGGEPLVLEPGDAGLERVEALVLTGGGDIDAAHYGCSPHAADVSVDPTRDDLELAAARRALEIDLPVLGICRGIQVLNVVTRGTLVQDIPSQTGSAVRHQIEAPLDAPAHDVEVGAGSLLADLVRERLERDAICRVNSRHHQSPHRVGEGFVSVAVAEDGVIEAIERPEARFCLGVQWHPENFWRTGEFHALFVGLVAATRKGRRARRGA